MLGPGRSCENEKVSLNSLGREPFALFHQHAAGPWQDAAETGDRHRCESEKEFGKTGLWIGDSGERRLRHAEKLSAVQWRHKTELSQAGHERSAESKAYDQREGRRD